MIKNIVFDVGKVLIDWNPYLTMRELGFSDDVIDSIRTKLFDAGAWTEEDRGLLSPLELEDYFVSFAPELEKEIRLFYKHATDSIAPRKFAIPWIQSLKKSGFKTYVLSNFGEEAMKRGVEMGGINFLDELDGYLFSYEVNKVKPEPEIYNALFKRYNLIPSECVFIDDLAVNIEAARALGMKGIVFESFEQVCDELKSMGVEFTL